MPDFEPMTLRLFRETLRLPIRYAARQAGIATASLQRWEDGSVTPRPDRLEELLNVYRSEAAKRIDSLAQLIRQPTDKFSW